MYMYTQGLFYYTLANLEPRFHGPTNMIQLVSVVKYDFVTKYGIDEILKPFVQDVSVLESVSC